MNEQFEPTERLFRSVRDIYWREDGSLDSNAFRYRKGLSVDRDGGRSAEAATEFLFSNVPGTIVSVSAGICNDNDVLIRPSPSPNNTWHCELHASETQVQLTMKQAYALAKKGNYKIHRYSDTFRHKQI